ncbi:hypothetical protein D3C74_215930 [compost metagenome]
MQEIIEKLPTLITVVGTIIVWVRLFIRTSNKTIVDMVVEPRNMNMWDKFIEIILLSSIMVIMFLLPMFMSEINPRIFDVIMMVDIILYFITLIIILIYWVCSWFKQVKGKVLNISIFTNYLLTFCMPLILICYNKSKVLNGVKENYIYGFIAFLALVAFHCILITFYPSVLRYFNKPEIKMYKLERIQTPHDILQGLYLLYMLDNERHVLSENSNIAKIGDGDFYIYYPKENALIKYFK